MAIWHLRSFVLPIPHTSRMHTFSLLSIKIRILNVRAWKNVSVCESMPQIVCYKKPRTKMMYACVCMCVRMGCTCACACVWAWVEFCVRLPVNNWLELAHFSHRAQKQVTNFSPRRCFFSTFAHTYIRICAHIYCSAVKVVWKGRQLRGITLTLLLHIFVFFCFLFCLSHICGSRPSWSTWHKCTKLENPP